MKDLIESLLDSDEKIIKIFGSSQNMMKEIIRQLEVKSKLN